MGRISKILYQKSNLVICILLTTIMVVYASIVMGSQSKCISDELTNGLSLLGLRFGYDIDTVSILFNSISENALLCYSKLLSIWDNIFPFIYGTMYIFWLSFIYKNRIFKKKVLSLINLYPVIPVVLDLIENYFENILIRQFISMNNIIELNVKIASIVTQIKWTLSTINYLIIIIGIVIIIKNKNRTTRHKTKEGELAL